MLAANFVGEMIGDRELQEVSRDSFVPEDRPRIFDRGANVEILRLRIVSRDEIEAAGVFIVDARADS